MSRQHRDWPELTPDEADARALLGIDPDRDDRAEVLAGNPDTAVDRTCDCGTVFKCDPAHAGRTSKWYRLCPSCLSFEI